MTLQEFYEKHKDKKDYVMWLGGSYYTWLLEEEGEYEVDDKEKRIIFYGGD